MKIKNKWGTFIIFWALTIGVGPGCKENATVDIASEKILDSLAIQQIDTFFVASSIRALEVVNDQTVWFAGSEGRFGFTEDDGKSWTIDSIRTDTIVPHFRAISVTEEAVFLLCIGSPALLYKSVDKGKNWEVVYREDHPAAFYDAMAFWDAKEGIAMGDPTEGFLSVIITRDGGNTWEKVDGKNLPPTADGEAAFAASNSNIALYGDHAWIVSGGKKARVFHSPDRGRTWEVFNTPIIAGEQMTGIFSCDFWDDQHGIIFGGNWEKQDQNTQNKALTNDGGHSWYLVAEGYFPGYRSCVQYAPDGNGKILVAAGIPGICWSQDGGNSWAPLSDKSFYTIRFGNSNKTAWVAGQNKIGKIVWADLEQ
ncbi:MAG: oxidoreductase [Saprospiraceae bacterium]|nr:oxidoreductase [Saprospiraceae bacterium]MCB9323646.1 oxidoreductase [Lewinellaceae bacterium]